MKKRIFRGKKRINSVSFPLKTIYKKQINNLEVNSVNINNNE